MSNNVISEVIAARNRLNSSGFLYINNPFTRSVVESLTDEEAVAVCQLIDSTVDLSSQNNINILVAYLSHLPLCYTELTHEQRQSNEIAEWRNHLTDLPVIDNLHEKVLDRVTSNIDCFNMANWHSHCGTTHCWAGWIETIAREETQCRLEGVDSTSANAIIIADKSDPTVMIDESMFFISKSNALKLITQFGTKFQ